MEAAPLFGGVKVVLHQANMLVARGHDVTIACPGEPPGWFPLRACWHQTVGLEPHEIPAADLLVATFWTTLPRALASQKGRVVHFCQGFEGQLEHNRAEHPAIDEAYRSEVPALTVSPHLATLIEERFHRPAKVVPQLLDRSWRPRFRLRPQKPARILATGPWEIYLKGVPVASDAVLELRRRGLECTYVRLSQWPLCDDERAHLEPEEFHHHVPPQEVPGLVRSCDLLLAPSWPVEGFGLPVLEAMASGVPTVVSDIPSFQGFASGASMLVKHDEAAAFAEAAFSLLTQPKSWRRLRSQGLALSRQYSEDKAILRVEEGLLWALRQ